MAKTKIPLGYRDRIANLQVRRFSDDEFAELVNQLEADTGQEIPDKKFFRQFLEDVASLYIPSVEYLDHSPRPGSVASIYTELDKNLSRTQEMLQQIIRHEVIVQPLVDAVTDDSTSYGSRKTSNPRERLLQAVADLTADDGTGQILDRTCMRTDKPPGQSR